MLVILSFIFIFVNAHGSLEDHFFVIRILWLIKFITIIILEEARITFCVYLENTTFYSINTNEIPSELTREDTICLSSHVKIGTM